MGTRARRTRAAAAALVAGVLIAALMTGEARGAPGWSWPVKGPVLTSYSNDESNPYAAGMHRGIDIAAPVGAVVRAARVGQVTYAGRLGYSGLMVAVRTSDGNVTSYLHLSAVRVRRGERVDGGAPLGAVGTTGRRATPEPHLHFGVRIARKGHHYVDPLTLLPSLAGVSRAVPAVAAPAVAPLAADRSPVRVPVRPSLPRLQPALPDRGRPLSLAGLAVLMLALLAAAFRGKRRRRARPEVAVGANRPGSLRPRSRPESAGLAAR